MTVTIPPIVSVDDHVIEPPHLWQRWLPAKWRRPLVETNPPRNSRLETHPPAGTSFKP